MHNLQSHPLRSIELKLSGLAAWPTAAKNFSAMKESVPPTCAFS
jgi:hypothetical protein